MAALKPVPVRTTVVPTGPFAGAKPLNSGAGDGEAVSLVTAATKVAVAADREDAITVVVAAAPDSAAVVLAELLLLDELDGLPVPLSEIVMASCALFNVKSACTVCETVPVADLDVR